MHQALWYATSDPVICESGMQQSARRSTFLKDLIGILDGILIAVSQLLQCQVGDAGLFEEYIPVQKYR